MKNFANRHTAPVGTAIPSTEYADRATAAESSNALLRRQLVYGQHGFVDPAAYGAACRVAGLPQ